ncbi:unnamed protein product [Toxocara canis]|uniref:Disintegrin domain-containing protein n=1 Tax=Toxocara canis TaxID=6265 RepID=A0A183UXJ6_TOXCA|nr:unnamed protein product [Toxocara canis]
MDGVDWRPFKGFGTVTYRHLRCGERSNGDSGFEEEIASGLEEGSANWFEEGSASGFEEGSTSGFEESGSGFEEGSGEGGTTIEIINLLPEAPCKEGIREIVVLMLDKPPRKITMTKKLFEKQQWLFERAENVSCVPFASCFNEDDCGGHTCTGLALNKCDCGACMTFSPCEDDSACGGLLGACNNETNTCDCDKGFRENGVDGMFGALTTVCNIKDCTPNSDSCFGLPCNKGVCSCV